CVFTGHHCDVFTKKGLVVKMFIIPISELQPIIPAVESGKTSGQSGTGASFEHVLKNAMQNLDNLQSTVDKDSIDLALGRTDDLHTIQLNTMKATAAIELTAGITSKVLSAYQQIVNIQL
ncbi:MAG TPA: flagellar hook-basal body complex protein FliE, partial [Clostridia bacterium]|nr:flagellar hook-basal body complex protein FliE [Clostridia bacterium]